MLDPRSSLFALVACSVSLATACSAPAPAGDAATDAAADVSAPDVSNPNDVGADAAPDAAPDTAPDITVDAATDAVADVAPDATADATADVSPDVAPDVMLDAAPDAATDVTLDVATDTTPDAALDAAPDATPSAGLTAVINQLGSSGNLDGVGAQVRFNDLTHTVYDGSRYLYAIERCAVRRVDTTASYEVSLFAGDPITCGAADGPRATARFSGLSQAVIDGTRALYISEAVAHRIRRIDLATGAVTTYAGALGMAGTADGPVASARFNTPRGLAIVGRALFVADEGNLTLRRIDLDAGAVTTVAGTAGSRMHLDGAGSAARFTQPSWLTTDGASRLFLVEVTSNTVRRIDLPSYTVTTLAGTPGVAGGFVDGVGAAARFNFPFGVVMIDANTLVVADEQNAALRRVDVNTRAVTTLVGGPRLGDLVDGNASEARLFGPYSPSFVAGTVFFPDFNGIVLRGLTVATGAVRTYAATARRLGTQVQIHGLTTDGRRTFIGRLGTVDELDVATGAFTTLAGDPSTFTTVDGVGSAARLYAGGSLTYGDGALYWYESPRYVVRRMDLATRAVTTLAGTSGSSGNADGVGPAARFDFVGGLAYVGGALYVADSNARIIRRIDVASRAVTTVAGARNETGTVDGVGAAARFGNPTALLADGANALYVADGTRLRRLDLRDMRVTSLAGSAVDAGFVDDVGAAARFAGVGGLASEPGYVYVADGANHAVRRFEVSTGRVTTVLGVRGRVGVRLGPLPTSLGQPDMLLSLGAGDLLLRDETSVLRARGL